MSQKQRYIDDVLGRIFASQEDRSRLKADLEAHFSDGAAAGESEAGIIARLGPAEEVAASFGVDLDSPFAGFWIRVLAFVIDIAALVALVLPFYCLIFLLGALPTDGEVSVRMMILLIPVTLWSIAVGIFYFPVLEHTQGKTLGKHLLGLRVLTESRTRIGLGQAFLRRLSSYFEFLVLDALFVPFTAKKQRAFDIVARTIVVREHRDIALGLFVGLTILAVPPLLALGFVFLAAAPA